MLYEIHTGKRFSKVVDDAMTFIVNHLDLPSHVWIDITMQKLPEGSCGGCVDEQTVNGRLDQNTWCGIDYTGVAYEDRPWEKEAYEFESRTISEYNCVNREDVH